MCKPKGGGCCASASESPTGHQALGAVGTDLGFMYIASSCDLIASTSTDPVTGCHSSQSNQLAVTTSKSPATGRPSWQPHMATTALASAGTLPPMDGVDLAPMDEVDLATLAMPSYACPQGNVCRLAFAGGYKGYQSTGFLAMNDVDVRWAPTKALLLTDTC